MDYRKIAILTTVGVIAIGGAVIGISVLRSRRPPPSSVPSGTGTSPPAPSGQPSALGTNGGPAAATGTTSPETKVVPPKNPPGCDTKNPVLDCDGDHLTNAEEQKYGTDPLKADTDGDGVDDGNEVYTWKTDPLNPHSVDPTMTDLEAINAGKVKTR